MAKLKLVKRKAASPPVCGSAAKSAKIATQEATQEMAGSNFDDLDAYGFESPPSRNAAVDAALSQAIKPRHGIEELKWLVK